MGGKEMYFKKIISICLTIALALTSTSVSYADTAMDLSLEQALSDALTCGASIKLADIQKQSDTATAKANWESYSNMSDANDSATNMFSPTYSTWELNKVKKAKEYYTSMADRNYGAAVNSITYTINDAYYSLMNAEEEERIATENVRLQNEKMKQNCNTE
jgi:outer membrane protein TolC